MTAKEPVQVFDCAECMALNRALTNAILALAKQDYEKCSHYFHGRYENLYIDQGRLPGMQRITETACLQAAKRLLQPVSDLKMGFWLNIMNRGDITTLHSHDDDDEVLSAVYYVSVPEQAGIFRLYHNRQVYEQIPVEGRFVFFDPVLPHEVSEHQSETPRISIGINFGLTNSDDE